MFQQSTPPVIHRTAPPSGASRSTTALNTSLKHLLLRDHRLGPIGTYAFEIAGKRLAEVLDSLSMPNRPSDELFLEVTSTHLTARCQTADGAVWAMNTTTLKSPRMVGSPTLRITFDRAMLTQSAKLCEGTLRFHFDQAKGWLSWQNGEYGAGCKARFESEGHPRVADTARVPFAAKQLAVALEFAATLKPRTPPERSYHGIRVSKSAAMGGYQSGVSQYTSSIIPRDLDFVVPHVNTGNVQFLLANIAGKGSLSSGDDYVHVRSTTSAYEAAWSTKGANWPSKLSSIFEHPLLGLCSVETGYFQLKAHFFAAFPPRVRFKVLNTDLIENTAHLQISGIFQSLPCEGQMVARIQAWTPEAVTALDQMTFSATDLAKAAWAIRSTTLEIGIFEQGLVIQSVAEERSCKTILWGTAL